MAACLVYSVSTQQGLCVPGVLAGYRLSKLQYMQGAQADIGQVADGRSD